jgi:probable HAF family extracellular repeat protein
VAVLIASVLGVASAVPPIPAAAQSFSVLGLLPASSASIPTGVSADGKVVVGYGQGGPSSSFSSQAFRWTQATGMVGLGFLPSNADESEALAANADGSVVVGYSSVNGARHPFRWTQATGLVDLAFLSGGIDGIATGVSADGTVVVGSSSASGISAEAFRWTQGGMVGLGLLPGYECQSCASFANAVSSDGTTVVGSVLTNAPGVGYLAFRWTGATDLSLLGDLELLDLNISPLEVVENAQH